MLKFINQKGILQTVFNKIKIVKCLLCKAYNIPLSTSINKGFYCSAPLLNIGGNIGL